MEGTVALFHGPGRPFELRAFPLPEPAPGEVLVRIGAASVCGSDLHMWRGELDLTRSGTPMPAVLGHEAMGVVVALGEQGAADLDGRSLAIGDRVAWRYFTPCGSCRACRAGRTAACQENHRFVSGGRSGLEPPHFVGAYGTHHLIPAGQAVVRVPPEVSDGTAALASCAVGTAVQGFGEVGLAPGETVVVQGAGGVGLAAVAVARWRGAGRIVVLDGVPDRLELARAFGADDVIDVAAEPDSRARVAAVRAATDGGGDVVAEFVGSAAAVAEGLHMVAAGGRYLEVGCVHTGGRFDLDPALLTLLSRRIVGSIYYEPAALREAVRCLVETVAVVPWDLVSAARYPLEAMDAAFEAADRRDVIRPLVVPG
jgi:threonine dehydrogenase-like Zn-dependent dehydrogenase